MGLAGHQSPRNIQAVAYLALILSFSAISFFTLTQKPVACFPGDIGTSKCPLGSASHDTTSLGIWTNFPSSSCALSDPCEMMNGNQSYRGILVFPATTGESGVSVGLEVNCINPTAHRWSYLQLQYATYDASLNHLNTTKFVNVAGPVYVDGGGPLGTFPCTGSLGIGSMLTGSSAAINASSIAIAFIFRVIGLNDSASGDFTRLSSVSVYLVQNQQPVYAVEGVSQGFPNPRANFRWEVVSNFPASGGVTITVHYIATNATLVACGASDLCIQGADATCSIPAGSTLCPLTTTIYAVTFATGTVKTVLSIQNAATAAISMNIGTLGLLYAQTLTV